MSRIFLHRSNFSMALAFIFLIATTYVLYHGFDMITDQFNSLVIKPRKTPNFSDPEVRKQADSNADGILSEEEMIKFSSTASSSPSNDKLTEYDIVSILSRLILLVFVFFLSQIFIKLYKYNISKSDYYRSLADGLKLSKDLDKAQIDKLGSALKVLGTNATLESPESPDISGILNKIKPEGK